MSSDEINIVAITTQHDSHANCSSSIKSGKHVFVEKPLAITLEELKQVHAAYTASDRHLMVGFNRRFSPLVQTMRRFISRIEPKSFVMVMNAGQSRLIIGHRIN